MTLVERVDKAILEQLLTSLDTQAILCLPWASDPLVAMDRKFFSSSCFLMFVLALRLELTLSCVFVVRFAGIMGGFAWRPLVKQVGPTG